MTITRRQALILTALPLFAQSRPKVAIPMDNAHWQPIPECRPKVIANSGVRPLCKG